MNNLSTRSYVIMAVFAVVGLIFIISLFRLQVIDSEYKERATNNVLRKRIQYPARGLIYDRNKNLLVYNKTAHDLLVVPREVPAFDTALLCKLVHLEIEDFAKRLEKAKKYSKYKPSIIVKQISPEKFAVLQEQLYKFKGFHSQTRTLREYTNPVAAHVLGYVGEVDGNDIKRDSYYQRGDYIGQSGIERTYEKQLRGSKGVKKFLVDVHNRIQGSYKDGTEDEVAEIGKNLTSTIDIDLQIYAEKLFQNKKGAVVAIEPSTGEVLTMLSAPTYDPNLLVGRVRGENYLKLEKDSLKPIFNRALQAKYSPGSTFKVINILIGLQEQVINTYTRFTCNGRASTPIRCTHDHVSPANVVDAIRESCNPFLWQTFRAILGKPSSSEEGFELWRKYVSAFGIGQKLGNDFPEALRGDLPHSSYYNKVYGKRHWNALTVRSLAIGQGELGATPLQMANCCAVIANRGFYYEPHIVRKVENDTIRQSVKQKRQAGIDEHYFEPIFKGMEQVARNPTRSIPGHAYCGKTGTIQNQQGSDHSAYIAFAPKENPKIALFVYVENGVWGHRYAAPIASLIMEKYLNDTIATHRLPMEQRMLDANLLNPNQPK